MGRPFEKIILSSPGMRYSESWGYPEDSEYSTSGF
jgi:hypothetical protein